MFIPRTALNALLTVATGKYDIPGANTALDIRSVNLDFSCGAPVLHVDAMASRRSLSVRMEAAALIDVSIDPAKPNQAVVRVALTDIKPDVQWGIFEFRLRRFAKDLIQLKLAEYERALPALTVPLKSEVPFVLPETDATIRFPVASGTIRGVLRMPGLSGTLTLRPQRMLFLEDGIHVYFAISY